MPRKRSRLKRTKSSVKRGRLEKVKIFQISEESEPEVNRWLKHAQDKGWKIIKRDTVAEAHYTHLVIHYME